MNLDNEYTIAARYRTIRKHLDGLGYRQALSLDALPLIEKLLSDLIQTTESLKHFKTVAHNNVEACSRLQLSIDPYKCDNARLVQECNQLHLDLIEAKETHQKHNKDLKKKVYTLESECNDLQAASSRNLKRIKELEVESSQKSKRIQELLGKCNKPLVNNVALGAKKRPCYPLRRPSLEAEPMPRSRSVSALPSHSKVDPQVVDLIGMADRKINSLSHEVTGLKEELSLHIDSVYTLKAQLATKEKEISRLRKMLEGGRPYSAVSKDCSCKKFGQCCDHGDHEKVSDLHNVCHKAGNFDELRILEKSKSDLEQQLREALDKQHDAMSQAMKLAERNEELEKELRDIDHIALAVEADCNSAVKENNKRVSQLQEKLESVMTQVHVLEGELMVERRSGQELRADLEGARLENRNLQRKLESSLDEKKQMTDRINQLTMIEQSLNEEIGRLSRANGNLKQEVARLDCANNLLKKQMIGSEKDQSVKEDFRNVKEKGEKNDRNKGKMLTKKKPVSREQRRSYSPPVHEKQTEAARRHSDIRDDEVTRDSNVEATKIASQRFNSEKDVKISQLQQTIDQVQTDRDFYKKEYNRLREQCMKNSEADNAELWGEVCELRRQLIAKEHEILELQREKKELCREKFELELRLQSSRSERRNVGHPCGQCRPMGNCACSVSAPMAGGDSKASSAFVERLERERDMARADVDRLVEERDTLRERLKLAVEAHKFEQRRLRENLCDVETRLKKLERERQDLLVAQGTQRATINGFEDQLEDLREELRRTKQELSTQRTQYFQLRTLQDQADQALGDVQGQLNHSEGELYKAMERNRLLEQQRMQLDNEVKSLKQEINTMRANRSQVDQEKERMAMELEKKAGRIAALERDIKSKEQDASGAEQQLQDLQHKYQLCVDQSAEQERRLRNMQMEMEIHQRQLAATSTDRDNAAQENRRLQDDLAAVTCEIRTLQRELEVSRAESYDLKKQLQTYVSEVRRAEDLINKKENERTEMLDHFRSLSLEATMLENNNHSLESEAAKARDALQAAQNRSLDLERQLADRDCLIRGYETQISELTQTVASLETQIRQQMDQRQRAEADLNAVRDLCVKLDQQKETLVKELGDKEAMKAQYEAQIARLKTEQTMVQDQINRDHVTVERLESLLDQARQESMDSQTANQELQCEMSRLKQRTCELQNKLSAESAELRRYQNQAAEYSKQIAELRRQVTNERFDRARKEEEHRSKNCLCGEMGNLSRRENLACGSSQDSALTRRLEASGASATNGPRYPESGTAGEYRQRGDLRFEAQRTNRFDAGSTRKGSTITTCKCSESNSKMYNDARAGRPEEDGNGINLTLNPDSTAGRADLQKTITPRTGETLRHELAHQATSNSGNLCVQATLEEDDKYKDIRVRISDASAHGNFDRNKTGVKFCSPLVCKDASRRTQIFDTRTDGDSSVQIAEALALEIGESSGRKEEDNHLESTQSGGGSSRERNEEQRPNLSTNNKKSLRSLNCQTNGSKNRVDRDRTTGEAEMESSEVRRAALSNDDDTSGYHTSETQNCRGSDNLRANDRRKGPVDGNKTRDCLEAETVNETLRILERLLQGRTEFQERRSSSVPRKTGHREFDAVRMNRSGPIRVDYSGASLTAADFTRPEFVQKLVEIKENTQNFERQLARINSAMKRSGLSENASTATENLMAGDKNPENCVEPCKSSAFEPRESTSEKGRKTTKKKMEDASSQDDFLEFPRFFTSSPRSSTKIEKATETDQIFDRKNEPAKAKKSNVALAGGNEDAKKRGDGEPKDRRRISKNRIYVVGPNDSAGTQTSVAMAPSPGLVLVDESTMCQPSKIHKWKNSPPSKQTPTREYILTKQSTTSEPPENSLRMSPPQKSFIPTRHPSPEKPRSASGRFSADLPDATPVASSDDSANCPRVHRDRRPWYLPQNASRSTSLNATRSTSVRDSVAFHTLHDTMHATLRSNGVTEVIEIERTRETPKPFTLKTSRKSANPGNSATRDGSTERWKASAEKNRSNSQEIARRRSRSGRETRAESASPRRPLENTIGRLFERRTPGIEYVNDRDSPKSSRSPGNRSRKPDTERELSMTNYRSNNSRQERADSSRWASTTRKSVDSPAYVDDARSMAQRRSRSARRESCDSTGRGY